MPFTWMVGKQERLPSFLSLGLLNVILAIALNLSGPLVKRESPGAVRLQEADQTGGSVGEKRTIYVVWLMPVS